MLKHFISSLKDKLRKKLIVTYDDYWMHISYKNKLLITRDLRKRYYLRYKHLFGNYKNIVIFSSNIGEVYVLLKYFVPQLISQNKDTLFVFTRKSQIQIVEMFGIALPMVFIPDLVVERFPIRFTVKQKDFLVLFPCKYYDNLESEILMRKRNYIQGMEQVLGLRASKDIFAQLSVRKSDEKFVNEFLSQNGLYDQKFVFILPEAFTCEDLSFSEVTEIVSHCTALGYSCIVNRIGNPYLFKLENIREVYLNIAQTYALATRASLIIGVKSGMLELLTETGVNTVLIPKAFKNRSNFRKLSVEDDIFGFSILHLPLHYKAMELTDVAHIDFNSLLTNSNERN